MAIGATTVYARLSRTLKRYRTIQANCPGCASNLYHSEGSAKECAILQIPCLGEAGRSESILGPVSIETKSSSELQNITNVPREILPCYRLLSACLQTTFKHQTFPPHSSKCLLHRRTLPLHPQSVISHHGGKLSRRMRGEKRKKVSLLFCHFNGLRIYDPKQRSAGARRKATLFEDREQFR